MRYTASQCASPLTIYGEQTGFYEGDLLLYTRNDWKRDLQNGLLGRLIKVFDRPQTVEFNEEKQEALGWAEWEGRSVPILEDDIDWLDHGYAISIHKSQGSQFERVVVPITRSRLLDRTLIYTAVTRAEKQIILVGNVEAMQQAVHKPPIAHQRKVALPEILSQNIHASTQDVPTASTQTL